MGLYLPRKTLVPSLILAGFNPDQADIQTQIDDQIDEQISGLKYSCKIWLESPPELA